MCQGEGEGIEKEDGEEGREAQMVVLAVFAVILILKTWLCK